MPRLLLVLLASFLSRIRSDGSASIHGERGRGCDRESYHPVEVPIAFDYITYPSVVGLPVPLSFGVEGMVEECEYVISVHILLEGASPLVYSRDVKSVVGQRVESFSFTPPPPATVHKCSIKLWVYDNRRHPDDDDALLAYALKVVEPARRAAHDQRTARIDEHGWRKTRMTLEDLMRETRTDKVWRHGFHRFYGGILDPLRDKPGERMLEIGVENGLSMAAWVRYFSHCADDGIQGISYKGAQADAARIACATEHFPGCEKMKIFDGDQSDIQFLRHVIREGAGLDPDAQSVTTSQWQHGGWDVVIDDGSHLPYHQIVTFAALFPFVRPGGLYIIEDVETSYFDAPSAKIYGQSIKGAGVGMPPPGNFVEKMKQLVDVVNRRWFYHPEFSVLGPEVDHAVRSISFAGNLIWVQKNFVSDAGYPREPVFTGEEDRVVQHGSVARHLERIRAEAPFPRLHADALSATSEVAL